jgi:CubicO group peptidase (beta-lactamase class C family)
VLPRALVIDLACLQAEQSPIPGKSPLASERFSSFMKRSIAEMTMDDLAGLMRRELLRGVEEGVFPGAAALLGSQDGKIWATATAGRHEADGPEMTEDTIFDLASVTKACSTATLAMRATAQGKLDPEGRVADYVPDFGREGDRGEVRVWHLLSHVSGLPWWYPFFEKYVEGGPGVPKLGSPEAKRDVIYRAATTPLEAPPGSRCVYSDLNFLLLGDILERAFGKPLDEAFRDEIAIPTGSSAHFRPLAKAPYPPSAPTEYCKHRGAVVRGIVHDENCWSMGGVAGHAGLFGRLRDLFAIACSLKEEGGGLVPKEVLKTFWPEKPRSVGTYLLGWDTPSQEASSAGIRFSSRSAGHLGFTGTMIWIDRDRRVVSILLTNRVHLGRENQKIRPFRRQYSDAVGEALGWPAVR